TVRFTIITGKNALVSGVDFSVHPATRRSASALTRHIPIPENTMPLLQNSAAFLEQLVRRARTVGGSSVTIPVVLLGLETEGSQFTITFSGDPVVMLPPGGDQKNSLHLALDADGHIVRGLIPISGTRIQPLN